MPIDTNKIPVDTIKDPKDAIGKKAKYQLMIGSILSNNDLDNQGLFSIAVQLDPAMYTNLRQQQPIRS